MAKFTFGKAVDIHWNGYEIVGPALTEFTIPDQLYEEFEGDFRDVEPSLTWIDTNEFATLSASVSVATLTATAPIVLTSTTTGKNISFSSGTALNGYLLAADGSGGSIWNPASTSGLTSVVGVSPISSVVSGGVVSVSLDASYQTAGTYVTSVVGSAPVSASGTTAITVSVDQAAITGATAATNAQVVRFYVKNTTGTTIPKGSAVYVSGATGDNALISLASATSEVSSSKTLGITAEAIATDAFGYVIEAGYLTDIDTSATTAGAAVWLGNTPGSLVFVSPPAEPSHAVYLGVVVRVQSMNGSILVKVQNGYELDELHDVSAATPADLDILQYKNSSGLWTKASIANAGIAASSHTHDYQASGTYVNAVIGTSPASVSTASGTSTVSIIASSIDSSHLADNAVVAAKIAAASVGTSAISSGAAANGTVLTANGSGGVTFASAGESGGYYVTGTSLVNGANLTSMPTGAYLVSNPSDTSIQVISSSSVTSTVAQSGYVYSSQRTSTSTRYPVMSSWISVAPSTSTSEAGSRFINGEFWIFGTVSTAEPAGLHRSSDAVSWTSVTTGLANGDVIRDIAYNGSDQYVLCGSNSVNSVGKVSTSPGTSGSTWTARTISANMKNANGVASSGSRWVVVGDGTSIGETLTSTDGVTWASNSVSGSTSLTAVAFGGSTFVAVGTSGKIFTSPSTSGATWTSRTSGVTTTISDVTYSDGIFAACTASSVLTSSDGITWTSSSVGVTVSSIVYATFTDNGPMWVATGSTTNWAFSVNSPPSGWTTGSRGNLTSGGTISYNNNILLSAKSLDRATRAVETTSFNSVWIPVTGVSA